MPYMDAMGIGMTHNFEIFFTHQMEGQTVKPSPQ